MTDLFSPPPYVASSDTSTAAAFSMQRKPAALLRQRILHQIREAGALGLTCDALEAQTGLSHQTASARVNELMKTGAIEDSGARRLTRSDRKATVWIVPDKAGP